MTITDLTYPVVVLDENASDVALFSTPLELAYSKPPFPVPGAVQGVIVIDAENRLFDVRSVRAVPGGWRAQRLKLAITRRHKVEYDLALIATLPWRDVRERVCAAFERQERDVTGDDPDHDVNDLVKEVLGGLRASADLTEMSRAFYDPPREPSEGDASPTQRSLGRGRFVLQVGAVALWLGLLYGLYNHFWPGQDNAWLRVAGSVFVTPCFFILIGLVALRLRDVGLSYRWALLVYLSPFAAYVLSGLSNWFVTLAVAVLEFAVLASLPDNFTAGRAGRSPRTT